MSFVTMAINLPSCFSIQFLEHLLKFLVNFTLLKYVKSQRSYGFLITKELIFGFQILDLNEHFSASLIIFFRYNSSLRNSKQFGNDSNYSKFNGENIATNCSRVIVLALDGLTKTHVGHYALFKIFPLRSPSNSQYVVLLKT